MQSKPGAELTLEFPKTTSNSSHVNGRTRKGSPSSSSKLSSACGTQFGQRFASVVLLFSTLAWLYANFFSE